MVDILLATYNGEKYLAVQLQSLAEQTFAQWHLYVRDDGSVDNTVSILEHFCQKHPDKVTILKDNLGNVGPAENFSLLMQASKSDYILFCDQDDKWLPAKIAITLQKMKELEAGQMATPCFVFTDLSMADADLNVIASSLWKKDKLNPNATKLGNLLMQNVPYGCAMMVNKSLLTLGTPIDKRALLQDHWLVLLAAAAGKIDYVQESTILHRVHGANASRGNNPLKKDVEQTISAKVSNKNLHTYFSKLQQQANAVKQRLDERGCLNKEAAETLTSFVNLRNKSFILRKWHIIKYNFFKNNIQQSIKWWLRL